MKTPFRSLGRPARARRANELAMHFERSGQSEEAIREYERACQLDPSWHSPAYNLGLLYKYAGDWQRSLECNARATELAPDEEASWWNLGIAATALGRWDVARAAWRGAGIDIPDGTGPIDCSCGVAPIRLNPDATGEVVWADRIDPARAVLRSIPLPESGFRYGDVVLNDGAPVGYRLLKGTEVPVFNCLARLEESSWLTWVAEIELSAEPAAPLDALCALADERGLAAENWTTSVRQLCKACSEGHPHSEHEQVPSLEGVQRVALAAPSAELVHALLKDWNSIQPSVNVLSVHIV